MTNETPKPKVLGSGDKFRLPIPIAQKQQLYQAIVTLFTVVLGIILTLSAQYVSSEFGLPASDPVFDPILGLGTTHFSDVEADTFTGALTGAVTGNVTGDLTGHVTADINTENIGLPTVITADIVTSTLTGTVATIADGEVWLVHSVFVQTTTNFDCTGNDCTLTVGDGNDADGFLAAADASIQAAFTEATGYQAGFYGIEAASGGAYTLDDGGPFVYAPSGADETIDYAIGGTDPAAGAATIYVVYTRIQ